MGRDFICAVIAHGEIDYVQLDRFPFDCTAFGLRRDQTGRRATDGCVPYWMGICGNRYRCHG